MTNADNEPPLPLGHEPILFRHDELGVIVVRACEQWGYAGPHMEHAHQAFREHAEEAAGNGDA